MAAYVKSIEEVSTTFNPSSTGLHTNTINLTESQDETQCEAFVTIRHTNGSQSDQRTSNAVGVEFFDNSGTPAIRVHWNVGSDSSPGDLEAWIYVVEHGSNVTVQQGSVNVTGTSATASISAVNQANAYINFTQAGTGAVGGDDFNDMCFRAQFNSNTQIQLERSGTGNPDWTVYYYVIESDGTDFNTEYYSDTWTTSETGPTNITLSNSVTLANAFLVAGYETSEGSDDMRDGICNVALTGSTTLTWYRNHAGTPSATGQITGWVVRASSSEFDVQRFATNASGSLTTNQAITAVDLSKSVIISNQNVGAGAWPISSTASGANVHDTQHSIRFTSTTNAQLQRQADTTLVGSNTNVRFEVVEFELEAAGGDVTMVADAGSYTWTGSSVDLDLTMPAGSGSYAWTGSAVDLDLTMPADSGSYLWSGQSVDLDLTMPAGPGSYSWTGQDANLIKSITMSAEAGSYSWTGQDATFLLDQVLEAETASYTWTGQTAELLISEVLEVDAGSYIWTGSAVDLDLNMPAAAASYSWTGSAATLLTDERISAESGSYTWTGSDATLFKTGQIKMPADTGSYSWTGTAANLLTDEILGADSGSFTWAGSDVTLTISTPSGEVPYIGFMSDIGRMMNH